MSRRRPSNAFKRLSEPCSPISDVAPSISTIGSRRRAAAIASPSCVCAFSRTRNASSSAWKVLRSTTLGAPSSSFMKFVIVLSVSFCGAFFFFLRSRANSIGKLRHELLTAFGSHVEKSPERIHGVTGSMMLARLHRSPGQFAPPEMTHRAIVETKHVEHRLVIVLAILDALLVQLRRKLRRIAEIIRVIAVAGGREKIKINPPAVSRPSDQARDGRLRDDGERRALADMAGPAVDGIKQVRAHRARCLAFRATHEAVED